MRARLFFVVALVIPVLVGADAAAGAIGGRLQLATTAARRSLDTGRAASSSLSTRAQESYLAATSRGGTSRDGWYSNEPGLSPQIVSSSQFGQLFATQLNGQIYAQPLLVGGVLFVATETDWIYGLNPATGAVEWSRKIGTPFRDASLGCADLTPDIGVTSTPTVDPNTGVVYLVDQAYVAGHMDWFMHAINPVTGAEMPHFPVSDQGPRHEQSIGTFLSHPGAATAWPAAPERSRVRRVRVALRLCPVLRVHSGRVDHWPANDVVD